MLPKKSWLLSLIIVLLLALTACGPESDLDAVISEPILVENIEEPVQEIVLEDTEVSATAVPTPMPEIETKDVVVETAVIPAISTATLTDTEIEALQFMREEEKLARDVYLVLYDQWGLPIFQNIAGSEQVHIDTVLSLMQRYGVTDSAADLGAGQFANAELQALYDQLIASGSQSLADALRVGALVEETDIADLENRLATLQNGEIIQAFNNLRQGSLNHLRSYAGMLERQTGTVYEPQILDVVAYADILSGTSNGFGNQSQGQGNNQGSLNGQGNGNGRGNSGNGQGNGRS